MDDRAVRPESEQLKPGIQTAREIVTDASRTEEKGVSENFGAGNFSLFPHCETNILLAKAGNSPAGVAALRFVRGKYGK